MTQAKHTVLIVEDESIVAHDVQQTLAELGYDAFAIASSADEAMARAGERCPDVALVDIRIKGRLDGIKTAQLLQERFAVPIVYLTAHADDATLERALRTHPFGYLLKPVKPAELRSAIEIALYEHASHERTRGSGPPTSNADAPPPLARQVRAPSVKAVRRELEQVFGSPDFDAPRRSREFLRFVVEETLAARGEAITQTAIATQVFARKDGFDAVVDPIVRIQAGRLRRSLERYYMLSGKQDAVRIELPKGSYVPVFSVAAAVAETVPQERRAAAGARADGWPLVTVGKFEVARGGPELEEVAARLREELAAELGGYTDLRVRHEPEGPESSRRSDVRFALHGRVQGEGDGLRVTARLVDRTSGEQIWADEYHTVPRAGRWAASPDDVARVIAARVGSEEGVVVQLLIGERRNHEPAEPTPYDAILRSLEFLIARDPASFSHAVDGLQRVVETEPECGPAWTRLARLYVSNHSLEVTPVPTPIDQAITFAQLGVRLDPSSRRARGTLAGALLVKGELTAARNELDEALRLRPNSLVYLEMIAWLLTLCGDWDRGRALTRTARERNPHCLPQVGFGLWIDHLHNGEFEPAYRAALEYRDPTFFWRSTMRACCLGHLGRSAEARAEVAQILSQRPDFKARGRVLIGHYIKFPEVMDRIVDGLAKAGLELA